MLWINQLSSKKNSSINIKIEIKPDCFEMLRITINILNGNAALSRVDNKTEICPECGLREAMQQACMSKESQSEVMFHLTKMKYKPGM